MGALRDNYKRGNIGDFLKEKIKSDSLLSFVSAYFTIYAYEKLKAELDGIAELRFLFGEPGFIKSLDPSKDKAKSFIIENSEILLTNRLQQKMIARECARWIRQKVQIKSVTREGFLHGKLYHIHCNGIDDAIMGSSNFTVSGLGLSNRPNIELNLEVCDKRDTDELKSWFDEIWNDAAIVEDVKDKVLAYLEQLYVDNQPEFIYFKLQRYNGYRKLEGYGCRCPAPIYAMG